jgi:predicted patatin/cPLA2 family phospholipase
LTHPVAAALRERPADSRIALVIEGGGMRGAVSGGMALGLDELGLAGAFDAAYGSSAGTLNAMWLVSGRLRDGIPTWTDPQLVGELISRRRALARRGPVVDVQGLVEERYERLSPGLFDAVLAGATELHPIATDVETAEAVDLHGTFGDPRTLRLALRASAALPVLAGEPVALDGRRYIDAGLSAAIPFRAALADGATTSSCCARAAPASWSARRGPGSRRGASRCTTRWVSCRSPSCRSRRRRRRARRGRCRCR